MEPFDRHQPESDDPGGKKISTTPLPQVSFDMKPVPPDHYYIRRSRWLILTLSFAVILLVLFVSRWVLYQPYVLPRVESVRRVFNDLVLPGIKIVVTSDSANINQVNVRQNIKITVQLTARDKHTILSQLQGNLGQGNEAVQQLLGGHNIACIDARFDADSDQLNYEPAQIQEYPLNQTTITWTWIVTPKQTGIDSFDITFSASGKSACATDKDPIIGPYLLRNIEVSHSYEVIDPIGTPTPTAMRASNTKVMTTPQSTSDASTPQNIFVQAYNTFGIGGIITTTLAALLTTFVTWICAQWWKQRKKKTNAKTPAKATGKISQSGKRSSRRNRKKPLAVK